MTTLRRLPAILAALLLAAHFLHAGRLVAAALCAVAPIALFLPIPGITTIARLGLLAGSAIWIWTARELVVERIASGRPYARMVVILGAVALFTAASAMALPRRPFATDADRDGR